MTSASGRVYVYRLCDARVTGHALQLQRWEGSPTLALHDGRSTSSESRQEQISFTVSYVCQEWRLI